MNEYLLRSDWNIYIAHRHPVPRRYVDHRTDTSPIFGLAYPMQSDNRATRMPNKHVYLISKLTFQVFDDNIYINDIFVNPALFEVAPCFVIASSTEVINET